MSTEVRKRPKPRRPEPSPTWNGIGVHEVPDGLTRERIVTAAIAVADQDGLPAVSIRRVASELNASAMALYHYVPSKRDLLNLMLDATYDEFALPEEDLVDWSTPLRHFAWESRRCLKEASLDQRSACERSRVRTTMHQNSRGALSRACSIWV